MDSSISLPVGLRMSAGGVREGGFSMGKVMFVIAVVGALLSAMGSLVPSLYDFYLLRDVADRVVGEYKTLSKKEVMKRVDFELDRSRIKLPEDTLVIKPTRKGYQVTIDYRIPLALELGGKKYTVEGYEELVMEYQVES